MNTGVLTVDLALTERLAAIRQIPHLIPRRGALNLDTVQVGDYLRVGANTYRINDRYRYTERYGARSWTWHELQLYCLDTGDTTYLEWEMDDELVISMSMEQLTLTQIGLTRQDLDRIDDDEEGSIDYQGLEYEYEDSGEARFHRPHTSAEGDAFYYYDFETGNHAIGIERWPDNSYEVHYTVRVSPRTVTVYAVSTAE